MQDNRKVAKAGLLMAAAAAVCRVISAVKEVGVAYVFGAAAVTDAYALAMLIPSLGMSLFVAAVRRAFLARHAAYQRRGQQIAEDHANQFVSSLLLTALVVALAVAATGRLAWRFLILSQAEGLIEASLPLVLPASLLIIPIALIAGLTAVLNARQRFALPQLTAALPTLAICCGLVWFGKQAGAMGLLVSLLIGSVVQTLVLVVMVHRAGHRLRWRLDWRSPSLRALWAFAGPLILLDLISQGNVFVDRSMATLIGEDGKVAILTWSGLLRDFIQGTLIASLLAVLLPHFSGQVARGATDELGYSCSLVLRYAATFLFPVSALLLIVCPVLFSHFQVGALDAAASFAIANCLVAYGLSLFADLSSTTMYQALVVLGRLRTLLLLAVFVNCIPNFVFNLLLLKPLGEVGLALSTVGVGYLTLLANYLVLRRTIRCDEEWKTWRVVAGSLVATLVCGAVAFLVLRACRYACPASVAGDVVAVTVAVMAFLGLYGGVQLVYPGNESARRGWQIIRDYVKSRVSRR
ncbi:MAG TPA: hypothetical protein DCY79_15065 [Planctomycetaceae bacterium]|nr:hypothetical protein [Planctomycetaceae bacterium]